MKKSAEEKKKKFAEEKWDAKCKWFCPQHTEIIGLRYGTSLKNYVNFSVNMNILVWNSYFNLIVA